MSTIVVRSVRNPWIILLLAIALGGSSFLLQARSGINLADEGFLWYGAQQTAHGEVPLRDFQSYDPGRYYWSAAGTFLFGKGLLALRFSETIFQIIGLWAGLLAATRIARSWTMLVAIGAMLTTWMFPSHKLFDHSLLLCGIWFATRIIEEPSSARIFAGGLFTGLCVFFGRNHALYNLLAQGFILLLLFVKVRQRFQFFRIGSLAAGLALGMIPIILMLLCVRGFAQSYLVSIESIVQRGSNLSLSVPWPWHITSNSASAEQFVLGILFLALPIFYIGTIVVCLFLRPQILKEHALFVACAPLGLFYLHHAFSRPDMSHLVQSIHPFALASVAVPAFFGERKRYSWVIIAIWIGVGLLFLSTQPVYQRWNSPEPWKPYSSDDKIFVPQNTQRLIDCVRQFAVKNLAPHDGVLIAPFQPGLYPIINRKSPVWDLAFYFPTTEQRQRQMIGELEAKNVNWAIISDIIPGSRDDVRFSATNELVWQYLMGNFAPFEISCLPRSMKIFHRKHPR